MLFLDDINTQTNCYPQCEYFYYFDKSNNYYCTENNICPTNYEKLVLNKTKCINKYNKYNIYQFEYNNTCYEECPEGTKSISSKKLCYDQESLSADNSAADVEEKEEKISNVQDGIMNGDMDDILKNISDNQQDFVQDEGDVKIVITTTENQKNLISLKRYFMHSVQLYAESFLIY